MKSISGFISLILLSAGAYVWYQWNKIQQYTITYGGQNLKAFSTDRIIADIYMNIINPSDVDLSIDGYDVDLYVNGSYTSKLISHEKQVIRAKSTTKFAVSLDFNPTEVLGQSLNVTFLKNLIKNRSKIEIRLKGEAKIFGLFNIPVDITTSLE